MSVIIPEIKTPADADESAIIAAALKKAKIRPSDVIRSGIHKISLDARKRDNIHLVSSVWAELPEALEKKLCAKDSTISAVSPQPFRPVIGTQKPEGRIAVAGFGPGGMFAALTLAEYGYRPIVFERGSDVDARVEAVSTFWNGGSFDPATNVQFGEGGAGTFSDGKLTTRIKDPLCRHILEKFTEMGAPEEILIKAKPHIGTDKLRGIVKNIRKRIIELGGEVRFGCPVTDIDISGGKLCSVTAGGETIPVSALILAIGHSARDTFEMLVNKGIFLEPKPFSCGARIEHRQEDVNRSLYGEYADNPSLPQGEYQLSYRKNGRGVYTFCMCPGGTVVPSQSEEETIVTNGMSEFSRSGANANAALVVSVSPDDFGRDPLSGVEFARSIERRAYRASGSYSAPATTVGAFLDGGSSLSGASVTPTYARGVTACGFDKFLPAFITDMMKEGIGVFSKKMHCWGDKGAVLTGPETRTSSPVRIVRGENFQAANAAGLYPCGEGAGYAGGIMSAAVDGIKCAAAIMSVYGE